MHCSAVLSVFLYNKALTKSSGNYSGDNDVFSFDFQS